MFLSQLTSKNGNHQVPEKKQYRVRDADGKPVVLELFINPGRTFDRSEIENPVFQGHLVREFDFRNKGNRRFLKKAEEIKDAWMAGKFGSPYQPPETARNVGRIFIPPTDDSQEVELARI
jgi:hypothetical protein